jgi:hypothetical protein
MSFWLRGLTVSGSARRSRNTLEVASKGFQRPPTDQAEEQARFVVMQYLNSRAIDHDMLLRMRDSRWSWISILDWIDARPSRSGAATREAAL